MNYVLRPALTLFITAALAAVFVIVAHSFTLEPIRQQHQRTQEATMREVFPEASAFNTIEAELSGHITAALEAVDSSGKRLGYLVLLSAPGYGGDIEMMVGISTGNQRVSGIRISRHTETPGLGALAAQANFYQRFENRALRPLNVVRAAPSDNDVQALTSATITSRAVTSAVNEAIDWYAGRLEQ